MIINSFINYFNSSEHGYRWACKCLVRVYHIRKICVAVNPVVGWLNVKGSVHMAIMSRQTSMCIGMRFPPLAHGHCLQVSDGFPCPSYIYHFQFAMLHVLHQAV